MIILEYLVTKLCTGTSKYLVIKRFITVLSTHLQNRIYRRSVLVEYRPKSQDRNCRQAKLAKGAPVVVIGKAGYVVILSEHDIFPLLRTVRTHVTQLEIEPQFDLESMESARF